MKFRWLTALLLTGCLNTAAKLEVQRLQAIHETKIEAKIYGTLQRVVAEEVEEKGGEMSWPDVGQSLGLALVAAWMGKNQYAEYKAKKGEAS